MSCSRPGQKTQRQIKDSTLQTVTISESCDMFVFPQYDVTSPGGAVSLAADILSCWSLKVIFSLVSMQLTVVLSLAELQEPTPAEPEGSLWSNWPLLAAGTHVDLCSLGTGWSQLVEC